MMVGGVDDWGGWMMVGGWQVTTVRKVLSPCAYLRLQYSNF